VAGRGVTTVDRRIGAGCRWGRPDEAGEMGTTETMFPTAGAPIAGPVVQAPVEVIITPPVVVDGNNFAVLLGFDSPKDTK